MVIVFITLLVYVYSFSSLFSFMLLLFKSSFLSLFSDWEFHWGCTFLRFIILMEIRLHWTVFEHFKQGNFASRLYGLLWRYFYNPLFQLKVSPFSLVAFLVTDSLFLIAHLLFGRTQIFFGRNPVQSFTVDSISQYPLYPFASSPYPSSFPSA